MMWNSVLFFTNTDIMIWICYIVKLDNTPHVAAEIYQKKSRYILEK
jgi:hypothetical protein